MCQCKIGTYNLMVFRGIKNIRALKKKTTITKMMYEIYWIAVKRAVKRAVKMKHQSTMIYKKKDTETHAASALFRGHVHKH